MCAAAGGVLVEITTPNLHRSLGIPVDSHREPPAAAAVGSAVPLGNNADFASFSPKTLTLAENSMPCATVRAFHLRAVGREILTRQCVTVAKKVQGVVIGRHSPRLRWCGSRIRRGHDGVTLYARPDRSYGRVSGVCVCGQSLACPVCAPRIAAFRSAEIADCFTRAKALGFEARLETFTAPHTLGSTLGREIDAFAAAWRVYGSGRSAVASRRASLGHHVGREVTWGAINGWHYHHHRCRYDRPGSYDPDRERYYWLAALGSIGRRTLDSESHAFDSGLISDAQHAEYVGKVAVASDAQGRSIGSEIASSATKGRNLASLLLAASKGDDDAARVWSAGVQDIV